MGYSTEFEGRIEISPPLNPHEIAYLKRFAESRHMDREQGPYYATGGHGMENSGAHGIRNGNRPPLGQPGLWCQWVPTEDGTALEWDGSEKFYRSEEWMAYIIETFLKPDAKLQHEMLFPGSDLYPERYYAPEFPHFTFNHFLTGVIEAQGEDPEDTWKLVVRDNEVMRIEVQALTPDNLIKDARAVALALRDAMRLIPRELVEAALAVTVQDAFDDEWLPDWFTGEDNGRNLWNGGEADE